MLSLSPGLGPDGLPSPGGYFPQYPTNGSGNNTVVSTVGNVGLANNGGFGNAGSLATMSGGPSSGNGSCNSNNPSPLLSGHNTVMGAQNSHRSSPCNELLAAAMRSSAHATNAAGELHWG